MAQEMAVRGALLTPTNLKEAMDFANLIAKSSMIPPQYKGKPADILLAVQMGAELGLAPLQALQNIATINGKPSIYGDAVIGLVRSFSGCEDVIETLEGDGDQMTAVCVAKRRGASESVARFSVADAKKAGLWNKAGPWQQYPKRMLAMRARGFALRDAFPDVLKGLITAEEAGDYPATREPKDITPKADLDAFAEEPQAEPEFLALAESHADKGVDAFRAWWRTLSKNNKDALTPHLGDLKTRAEQADAPPASVADDDTFGFNDPDPIPATADSHPSEKGEPTQVGLPLSGDAGQPTRPSRAPKPVIITSRVGDAEGTVDDLIAGLKSSKTLPESNAFIKANGSTIQALPDDAHGHWHLAMTEWLRELEAQ